MTRSATELTDRRGQLRRADKIMTTEEVDAFLEGAFCGRTATIGADGYPYVVPNLFVWHGGTVYLHTGRHPGHFAANVRHCKRVSFEVDEPGEVLRYPPAPTHKDCLPSLTTIGCARCSFASAMRIEPVSDGAFIRLISTPKRRLHLNSPTHSRSGTKAATAKPRAKTRASRR